MWNLKDIRIIIWIIIPLLKTVIMNRILVVVRHQQSIVAVHFKVHRFGWVGLRCVKQVRVVAFKYGHVVTPLGAFFSIDNSITLILKRKKNYKIFREMCAPWLVRTSSLYFHKARALRHTSALLRYNARSLRHRYELAQFTIHFIKEIKNLFLEHCWVI